MIKQKHIEIYRGKGKHPWRYRMVAANGEIIAQSEGYTRRSSARRGALRDHPGIPVR